MLVTDGEDQRDRRPQLRETPPVVLVGSSVVKCWSCATDVGLELHAIVPVASRSSRLTRPEPDLPVPACVPSLPQTASVLFFFGVRIADVSSVICAF